MRTLLKDTKTILAPRSYNNFPMVIREKSNDDLVCRNVLSGREYRHTKLESNQLWLDIGGHIGAFSKWVADRVYAVNAYEPDPFNCMLFRTNTKGLCVALSEAAVWKKEGQTTLWKNRYGGKDMHSLYFSKGRVGAKVYTVDFAQELIRTQSRHVKIDAEGAEWDLLVYLEERHPELWDQIDQLVFEFHFRPIADPEVKRRYSFLLELLKERGYDLIALDPKRVRRHWHTVVWAGRR